MNPDQELKKLEQVQKQESLLFKQLTRNCFLFLAPYKQPSFKDFERFIYHCNKILLKKKKSPAVLEAVNKFLELSPKQKEDILPSVLIQYKDKLDKLTFDFLAAQFWLQRLRWYIHLPLEAEYALEFMLDPVLVERFRGQVKHSELKKTVIIDLPFALVSDQETGEFDLKMTIKKEKKYHLIKSKLTSLARLKSMSKLLFYEFENFSNWAFFVITFSKQLDELSIIITEQILDYVNIFAYDQIRKNIPLKEAKENASAKLKSFINYKNLDKLPIYRFESPIPLSIFVQTLLDELQSVNPDLDKKILKEFYGHIFKSIEKLIKQETYFVGDVYFVEIRRSTELEQKVEGNLSTVINYPTDQHGKPIDRFTEFYRVKLTDPVEEEMKKLATNNLDYVFFD